MSEKAKWLSIKVPFDKGMYEEEKRQRHEIIEFSVDEMDALERALTKIDDDFIKNYKKNYTKDSDFYE